MRVTPIAAIAAMSLAASPALAVTGSGTVEFRFTSFFGPYQTTVPAGVFGPDPFVLGPGSINGVTPTPFGSPVSTGNPNGTTWQEGSVGATLSGGTFPLTGAPTTTVRLLDQPGLYAGDPAFEESAENIFSWTPASFSNVAIGQQFTLGTLTFKNGAWFGGGVTSADNRPTRLGFRVTTFSSDPRFQQSRNLVLVHTVNAPFPNDTSVLAGQEAAADWVSILDQESGITLNSFRVFDRNQTPPGFTNTGTVDLIGAFGSLNIIGFANPQGGFITPDNDPLPPVIPGGGGGGGGGPAPIPEPASWVMLIAGFGLVGAVARRRRMLAV